MNAKGIQFSWVCCSRNQVLLKDILPEMQEGGQDTLAQCGEIIGVTVSDFANQPMQAQPLKQSGDATARPVFQYSVQASGGQPAQRIFPSHYGLQYLGISFQEWIKAPV